MSNFLKTASHIGLYYGLPIFFISSLFTVPSFQGEQVMEDYQAWVLAGWIIFGFVVMFYAEYEDKQQKKLEEEAKKDERRGM